MRLSQALLWQSAGEGCQVPLLVSPARAADQYVAALLSAATIRNQALAASTRKQRGLCWDEFCAWMEVMRPVLLRGALEATIAQHGFPMLH
jgi:hypothetical protein